MATERKAMVGGGNSYRFSLILSPSQFIFVYESGNQMFLLSAKPNIGRAFEQCRLTVFLRLSIVIVQQVLHSPPTLTPHRKNGSPSVFRIIYRLSLFLSSISISRSHITKQYTTADTPSKSSWSTSIWTKNLIPHNRYIILYTRRYIHPNRYITRNSLILTVRVHSIFV